MSDNSKMVVGALIALNLVLVGLLMFRERSIAPASAGQQPAITTPAATERTQSSAYAPQVSDSEAVARVVSAPVYPADSELARPNDLTHRVVERPQVRPTTEEPESNREPDRPSYEQPEPRPAPQRPTAQRPAPAPRPKVERPSQVEQVAVVTPAEQVAVVTPAVVPQQVEVAPVPKPRPRPQPVTVTVEAGRNIPIRLDVGLHSRQVRSGDRFDASLAEDVIVDGRKLAVAGTPVTGRIVDVTEAGRVKGVERMRVTLNELTLAGKTFEVSVSTVELLADDSKDRDAKVVGATTAVGAIIGAIAKGKKGAATGAATGAAAGAGVVLSTRGEAVELASGSRLDFVLAESIRVTVPGSESDVEPDPEVKPVDAPGVARR